MKFIEIKELIENPLICKRLERIESLRNGEVKGLDFSKIIRESNCCGSIAYALGKVNLFREYSAKLNCDEFLRLPLPEENYPGYIPPRAGLEFIRKNCKEIDGKDLASGDLVLYMDRMYFSHGGIYLGNKNNSRIMFHKDGQENDFSFDDLDLYWPVDDADIRSFHRIIR